MEMPKPGEAHRVFAEMAGRWEGDETMHPQPWAADGAQGQAKIDNRIALSGFVLLQDYVQYQQGRVVFEGHGVLSWDDSAKQYVMHWWDSMGMPPNIFRGGMVGGVLSLASDFPDGATSRSSWDLRQADSYTFRMEVVGKDGSVAPMMEGSYRRVG